MDEFVYPELSRYIRELESSFNLIPDQRKQTLRALTSYLSQKILSGEKGELVFICTHNSRRSHIAQLWSYAATIYFDIPFVVSYSGGTEVTAFNPRAVLAMQEAGFMIRKITGGDNPVYEVRCDERSSPSIVFSKVYTAAGNPEKNFCAVMTCSQADESCPMIIGASSRISLPYEDPKSFDGTAQEAEMYRERVNQIGREMMYAFSLLQLP